MEGDGGLVQREHDLVALSLGMVPDWNPAGICPVSIGQDAFLKNIRPSLAPTLTDLEGVFAAGTALGPKDIVDTIAEAGAAAMEASNYLTALKPKRGGLKNSTTHLDLANRRKDYGP